MLLTLLLFMVAQERPAQAIGDPGSWMSHADYPAEALRTGAEGTARIAYQVELDGRVSNCVVRESSGSAALDETTCRLVTERGRYQPATDAAGRPRVGRAMMQMTWRYEGERLVRQPWQVSVAAIVDEAGRVEQCTTNGEVSGPAPNPCTSLPRLPAAWLRQAIVTGGEGRRIVFSSAARFDGQPTELAQPGGARLIAKSAAQFLVQSNGRVTACSITDQAGTWPSGWTACGITVRSFTEVENGATVEANYGFALWTLPTGRAGDAVDVP